MSYLFFLVTLMNVPGDFALCITLNVHNECSFASQGQCESAEFEVVIYQVTQTPHNQSIINHSTAVPNVCMLLSVFLPFLSPNLTVQETCQ